MCACVCALQQVFAERYVILLPREQQEAILASSNLVLSPRASISGLQSEDSYNENDSSPGAVKAVKALLDAFKLSPDLYQVR